MCDHASGLGRAALGHRTCPVLWRLRRIRGVLPFYRCRQLTQRSLRACDTTSSAWHQIEGVCVAGTKNLWELRSISRTENQSTCVAEKMVPYLSFYVPSRMHHDSVPHLSLLPSTCTKGA